MFKIRKRDINIFFLFTSNTKIFFIIFGSLMNIEQIKRRLDLGTLIEKIGCEFDAKKSSIDDKWFKSPFRPNEKDASFHLKPSGGIWYDLGSGEGGDLIEFARLYTSYKGLNPSGSVKDALPWLKGYVNVAKDTEIKPAPRRDPENETEESVIKVFEIVEDRPIWITSLLQNLTDRKLNIDIAKHYLRQIKYLRPPSPKEYFGFGFRNRLGDREFSNPIPFKTVLGRKDISFIKGVNSEHLEVFEGVWDFLSRLTIEGRTKPLNDCLVLNSTSLHDQACHLIKSNSYHKLFFWLDNDKAGHQTFDKITKNLPEALKTEAHKMNAIYEGYKDLNDWHIKVSLNPIEKRDLIHQTLQSKGGSGLIAPHQSLG